jgi:hypothetical protein
MKHARKRLPLPDVPRIEQVEVDDIGDHPIDPFAVDGK